ncbi:hypothetical protein [Nocardia sp. NPDC049707]|uniref:hypothetical protein n=1 Tax=Nocardia sp. NPDC049707 TaxID=3154735 RepID=UPI003447B1E0
MRQTRCGCAQSNCPLPRTSDGNIDPALNTPTEMGGSGVGTDPELFAAGTVS